MKMWYIVLNALLPGVLGLLSPDNCNYVKDSERYIRCSYGDSIVTVSWKKDAVHFICNGNDFKCPDLPRLNLAKGLPVRSLGVWSCPTHLLRCMHEVLNATSIKHVTLTMMTSSLMEDDVQHLKDVTMLKIDQANVQESVPIAAINSLPKLKDLQLNGSFQLSSEMFINSPPLELLELNSDNIQSIPEDVFKGLQSLVVLKVQGRIDNVKVEAFNGIYNLSALTLNSNKLKYIDPDIFASIPKLGSLQINGCSMTSLPQNTSQGLDQVVNTFANNLVLDNTSFSKLNNVKNIDLRNNGILLLPSNVFQNCTNIERLDLSENKIMNLTKSVFSKLTKLTHLNLSYNELRQLPDNLLVNADNLECLNLDGNHLKYLPEFLITNQIKLKELSIDNNFITSIFFTCYEATLKLDTVSLASDKLAWQLDDKKHFFPQLTNLDFQYSVKLKKFDFSKNRLSTTFGVDWRSVMFDVQISDLWKNISKGTNFCSWHTSLSGVAVTVDLRDDTISRINFTPHLEEPSGHKSVVGGNKYSPNRFPQLDSIPIKSDCHMYGLKFRLRTSSPNGRFKLFLDQARCAANFSLEENITNESSFDHFLCDVTEDCPNNCICIAKIATNEFIIYCKELPETLPNTGVDYLVGSVYFIDYFLQTPTITVNLKEQPDSIQNYNIHTLNLSNTNIKDLVIKPSKSLKVLDLSNNDLNTIPVNFILSNVTLYLANNPFECVCSHAESISLLKKYDLVPDYYKVTCNNGEFISTIDITKLCNTMKAIVTAISVFAVLAFILLVSTIIIYRYKNEIMLYLSTICSAGCIEVIMKDSDKTYDVFISFAHQNFDFVDEILLPKLENDFNQKVCVHYRDWNVGELIPTQIIRSVEDSRKTIIVLSKGFLESVWANLEFSAAHNLALQEKQARVILILLNEDITKHERISPELRAYINTNTYLVWGDPKFWFRLYKALPKIKHRFNFGETTTIDAENTLENDLNGHLLTGA